MSTAPPPSDGPTSGNPAPQPTRQEIETVLVQHYSSLPAVPNGSYRFDLELLNRQYADRLSLPQKDLERIIKQARAKAREAKRPISQSRASDLLSNSSKWVRWIKRISIGVFVLAAIGSILFASVVKRAIPQVEDIRPQLILILTVTALLFILSYGRTRLQRFSASDRTAKILDVGVLILFFAILLAGTTWLVVYIARDISHSKADDAHPTVILTDARSLGVEGSKSLIQMHYNTQRVDRGHTLLVELSADADFRSLMLDPPPQADPTKSELTVGVDTAKGMHGYARLILVRLQDLTNRLAVSNIVSF